MKLNLFLTSCLLSASLVLPDPAQANSPVQKVLSSEAQGLDNTLRTITVWAGAGANLNFIPTGEIVKKVWLDDPSQITLDFDGPMCMQAGDLRENNCENSAATVVHLRRIHAIKFPDLPQTASTLLSVVTQTSTGERKLYQFRIAYGSGKPQYHTVAIYPDAQTAPTNGMNGLLEVQLQDIERGLQVAKSRKLLGRSQGNQRLELRVQNFLALVRNGATLQSASKQAGVSMPLISKLVELSTTASIQQPLAAQALAQNQLENFTKPSATTNQLQAELLPNNAAQQPPNFATSFPPSAPKPQQPPTSVSLPTQRKVASTNLISSSRAMAEHSSAPSTLPASTKRLGRNIAASRSSTQATKYSQQAINDANAAAYGLGVARQKGQINLNTLTWKKAQGAIRQLRLGKGREEAARLAGIDMSVLSQLIKWGQTRP